MNVIICISCGEKLFRCTAIGRAYAGDVIKAKDFIPIAEKIPQPEEHDEMICPFCKNLFGKPALTPDEGCVGLVFRLDDGSWWPSPPIRIRPKKDLTP